MPTQIEAPEGMASFFANPEKLQHAIDLLNGLAALDVQIVSAGGVTSDRPGHASIMGDPGAMILPLPLKLAAPIADSTASALSVSTQLNLLLAALRKNGQLPS